MNQKYYQPRKELIGELVSSPGLRYDWWRQTEDDGIWTSVLFVWKW